MVGFPPTVSIVGSFWDGEWRRATGVAVLATSGSAVSACGSAQSSARPLSETPGASSQTPRPGGTLTVGVNSEVGGFLPSQDNFDNTGTIYADTVFDTLTKVGSDGAIHPHLATSVTPNAGGRRVWTVGLRQGVRFSDGSVFAAGVVAANFRALKQGLLTSLALAPLQSISIVNNYTVQYTSRGAARRISGLSHNPGGLRGRPLAAGRPRGEQTPCGDRPIPLRIVGAQRSVRRGAQS